MSSPRPLTEDQYRAAVSQIHDHYSLSTYTSYWTDISSLLDRLDRGLLLNRRYFLSTFLSLEVVWKELGAIDDTLLKITTQKRPGGYATGLRYTEKEPHVTVMEGEVKELEVDAVASFIDVVERKAQEMMEEGLKPVPVVGGGGGGSGGV